MSDDLSIKLLVETPTLSLRDVICGGQCRHKSAEECAGSTYFVFPYRGAYVRHLGSEDAVAEPNQVLFFNKDESYRVSHPVSGGDACLSLSIREPWLNELVPKEHVREGAALSFHKQRQRNEARTQAQNTQKRQGKQRGTNAEAQEAETLVLTLVRRALGERTS